MREGLAIGIGGEMAIDLPFDDVCMIGTIRARHLDRRVRIMRDDDRADLLTDLVGKTTSLSQELAPYLLRFPFEPLQEHPNIAMIVLLFCHLFHPFDQTSNLASTSARASSCAFSFGDPSMNTPSAQRSGTNDF